MRKILLPLIVCVLFPLIALADGLSITFCPETIRPGKTERLSVRSLARLRRRIAVADGAPADRTAAALDLIGAAGDVFLSALRVVISHRKLLLCSRIGFFELTLFFQYSRTDAIPPPFFPKKVGTAPFVSS